MALAKSRSGIRMDPQSSDILKCEPVAVYSYYLGESPQPPPTPEPSESAESPEASTSAGPSSSRSNARDSAGTRIPSKWYGCSGFIWKHRGKYWGITYGSALIPLLENAPSEMKEKFIKSQTDGLRRTYDRDILDTMDLDILKENSINFPARIAAVWTCPLLADGIQELMDMGWRFNGIEGDLRIILPMIVVFIPSDDMVLCKPENIADALVALLATTSRNFMRGNPVMVVSSPFAGNMVPLPTSIQMRLTRSSSQGGNDSRIIEDGPVYSPLGFPLNGGGVASASYYTPFLNSWSQGLLSGTSGANRVIIITDARSAVGSEGGPLFVNTCCGGKGKWWHAGMLLRSLCYWRDEYIGYSVAVNLRPALLQFLGKNSRLKPSNKATPNARPRIDKYDSIQGRQIVLIKCGHNYSSGVPINGELGLILTCAHGIMEFQQGISVFLVQNSPGLKVKEMKATLIYKTPPGKAYDIALISVGPGSGIIGVPLSKNPPKTGEQVLSVGWALSYGKGMEGSGEIEHPLISGGIVAAVTPGNPPPKLQTTCCVQGGCSGGAILRKADETLLGVIVCNTAKHPESSTFPHINFSVPTITLKPFLEAYYRTKDPSVLNGICTPDKKVQRIWNFGEQEPPVKRSKL